MYMNFSKLWETGKDTEAWHAESTGKQIVRHDLGTKQQQQADEWAFQVAQFKDSTC